jgi:serine/threonine protein kinase
VFTEVHIASFEAFRDKSSVVDIYDYGVDSNGYHLVMKRYKHSLKEWRVSQSKSLKENLSLYLSLYKDILKAVELFHLNNVTHYDIKADNIFLDVTDNEKQISDSNLTIALGDLGECKMFISDEDEF